MDNRKRLTKEEHLALVRIDAAQLGTFRQELGRVEGVLRQLPVSPDPAYTELVMRAGQLQVDFYRALVAISENAVRKLER